MKVATESFFMYCYTTQKTFRLRLVQSFSWWLDGGRSDREVCIFTRSYNVLIKNYEVTFYFIKMKHMHRWVLHNKIIKMHLENRWIFDLNLLKYLWCTQLFFAKWTICMDNYCAVIYLCKVPLNCPIKTVHLLI